MSVLHPPGRARLVPALIAIVSLIVAVLVALAAPASAAAPTITYSGDTTAGTSPYCSDHTKRAFSGVKTSRPAPLPRRV